MVNVETKEFVAVSWLGGTRHKYYEDRSRMLDRSIPIVKKMNRGEIFAVFDGIGSAKNGRGAAEAMASSLVNFYKCPDKYQHSWEGLHDLLMHENNLINGWGFEENSDKPLGGCAGSVIWLYKDELYVYHAGDTIVLLIRDGQIIQLTELHEFIGGDFSGAIYKYFGMGSNLKMSIEKYTVEESDRIVLMSDGVTKAYTSIEAGKIIEEYLDIRLAVSELVRRSRLRGSQDDITAMLVQIEEIWE